MPIAHVGLAVPAFRAHTRTPTARPRSGLPPEPDELPEALIDQHRSARRAAGGTETPLLAYVAAGPLSDAVVVYRCTVGPRPYSSWPAWPAGAAAALLLASAVDLAQRLVLPPLAGAEAVVTLVPGATWRRRRNGPGAGSCGSWRLALFTTSRAEVPVRKRGASPSSYRP